MSKSKSFLVASSVYVLAILAALFFTVEHPRYDLIFGDYTMLRNGFITTVIVSVITLICSMMIGFVLFLGERSENNLIHAFAVIFNEIMMGTPLLIMVFLAVYVIGDWIHISDKLTLGIFALTLYMAPYLSNTYKTAVAVVDDDQYKVMDLYDFTIVERYVWVILPQMIKPMIPSLINQLSSIIKGSALLKIVSVTEISYVVTAIASKNWTAIEGYYVMWMMYLVITIPLSLLAQFIARRVTL